jgi:pyridoxamine 5'-phosphate oxidase
MADHLSPAQLRRAYAGGGLTEADVAATWTAQFASWFSEARDEVLEPNAMVVATASADGRPSARTVLLKAFDERGLVFFTNLGSRKGAEATANPRAALVFPWIVLQRQVVVDGDVEPVDEVEADAYFASRPHGSRLGAHASPQSTVISDRSVIETRYAKAAARWPEGADVPRPEGWGGLRVVPRSVEFWQGRPDRMHDRLRFRRDGASWVVERLAP